MAAQVYVPEHCDLLVERELLRIYPARRLIPAQLNDWPAPGVVKELSMEILGMILCFVGAVMAIIGSIWFLVVAFQESVLWGLGCLIFGPVGLVFLIMHWDVAGKPFLLQLAGAVPMIAGIMMMGPPAA